MAAGEKRKSHQKFDFEMSFSLSASVASLPGVGPAALAALKRLGVTTLRDLLHYAPVRYEDFSRSYTLAEAPLGVPLTVQGKIFKLANRRSWKNRRLVVTEGILTGPTGAVKLVWFGQPFVARTIPLDVVINCSGVLEERSGTVEMVNPVWERVSREPLHTHRLVPDYALTRGLTSKQIRTWVAIALERMNIIDYFDTAAHQRYHLVGLSAALRTIHFPERTDDIEHARRRLAFDELFFLSLSRTLSRRSREERPAPMMAADIADVIEALPFPLTTDQQQAVDDISRDFTSGHPMARLLQGDVGSGKTVVAGLVSDILPRADRSARAPAVQRFSRAF